MRRKGEGFSDRLERILDRDNKIGFVKLLKDHPREITTTLVEKCAEFGAKKCLLGLLNGDPHPPPPALDAQPESGITALAFASHCCPDPLIIELMLNRCDAIPLANVSCTIGSIHALPIQFVLVHLSYLEHLYPWARGDSLIKLVILLCQWKTKSILDSARLLAQHTDSINNIAWTFVKYGALKQFGALLLVAREKVMSPFDTDLTIRQRLTIEIDSFSEGNISGEKAEHKNMLIDAQQLLDVFERAGDALSLYCSSMQKYVSIEKTIADVCELLKKYEVHVCRYDLLLRHFFKGYRALGRINFLKLEAPYDTRSGNWLHVPPAGGPNLQYTRGAYPLMMPMWLPSAAHQRRFMSTRACHVTKINKASEHAHPLKHLAYLTMKLKKRLRIL